MARSTVARRAAAMVRDDSKGGFPKQQQSPPGRTEAMKPVPDHGEETWVGHDRLKGLKALITGGDSGIGRAVAIAYAREGADVAIGYLPAEQEDAEATAALVEEAGRTAVLVPGDLVERETCEQVVADAVEQFGRLDILVANAGVLSWGRLFEIDEDQWDSVVNVNLSGTWRTIRAVVPAMIEAGKVYTAVPPLHRFELTNPKRGQAKYIYTYSEAELHKLLKNLERRGKKFKEPIQRYKGLGEMDADQLADTTMDPRHRMLRRVRIEDAEAASAVFELLMGSEVAPRKQFIIEGAEELDLERIDA